MLKLPDFQKGIFLDVNDLTGLVDAIRQLQSEVADLRQVFEAHERESPLPELELRPKALFFAEGEAQRWFEWTVTAKSGQEEPHEVPRSDCTLELIDSGEDPVIEIQGDYLVPKRAGRYTLKVNVPFQTQNQRFEVEVRPP